MHQVILVTLIDTNPIYLECYPIYYKYKIYQIWRWFFDTIWCQKYVFVKQKKESRSTYKQKVRTNQPNPVLATDRHASTDDFQVQYTSVLIVQYRSIWSCSQDRFTDLTLSTLRKIFSRRHIGDVLFYFPQNTGYDISCKLSPLREFAWNVKSCFLVKIRKNITNLSSA